MATTLIRARPVNVVGLGSHKLRTPWYAMFTSIINFGSKVFVISHRVGVARGVGGAAQCIVWVSECEWAVGFSVNGGVRAE